MKQILTIILIDLATSFTSLINPKPTQQTERIVDTYKESFFTDQVETFDVPDYDFANKLELRKISDSLLLNQLSSNLGFDFYMDAECYFYSLENRLPDLQDFTVYIRHPDGYSIYYCILDDSNDLISFLQLSYQFAMGEYSEEGYGSFIDERIYVIEVVGMADPYEDADGSLSEGSETQTKITYHIFEDGTIEEEN